MVKIIRCPSCGALWEAPDAPGATLCCSACNTVFAADKAESVVVDAARLEERLKAVPVQEPASTEPEAPKAEAPAVPKHAEEQFEKLAPEVRSFQARRETPLPKTRSPLWGLLALTAVIVGGAALLLVGHARVTASAPMLAPVYEKVCRTLPCPGFVWHESAAFKLESVEFDEGARSEGESIVYAPSVTAELVNTSAVPQGLPPMSIRFIDEAGSILAQRVLDAADYGAPDAVIAPKGTFELRMSVSETLRTKPVRVEIVPVVLR